MNAQKGLLTPDFISVCLLFFASGCASSQFMMIENAGPTQSAARNDYTSDHAFPDQSLIQAGLEWKEEDWTYQGKVISILYDRGNIYQNDHAQSEFILCVERDDDGEIVEMHQITHDQLSVLLRSSNH